MTYKLKRPYIARNRYGATLPMLVTGQHLSFDATRVRTGRLRGIRYEVWQDPLQRGGFVGVVYSPYESESGVKGEEAENIGTSTSADGAAVKADQYIERLWRMETGIGYKLRRHRFRNPVGNLPTGSKVRFTDGGGTAIIVGRYPSLKDWYYVSDVQGRAVGIHLAEPRFGSEEIAWRGDLQLIEDNPLAMGKTERNVLLGVGIVGTAALIYELTKKSTVKS